MEVYTREDVLREAEWYRRGGSNQPEYIATAQKLTDYAALMARVEEALAFADKYPEHPITLETICGLLRGTR